jgi:hypothetical protein
MVETNNAYFDCVGTVKAVAARATILAVGKALAVELEAFAVLTVALHTLVRACMEGTQRQARPTDLVGVLPPRVPRLLAADGTWDGLYGLPLLRQNGSVRKALHVGKLPSRPYRADGGES